MDNQTKVKTSDSSRQSTSEKKHFFKNRIEQFSRGQLTFKVIDSGPLDGKPIILLHGFPEVASSWKNVSDILNQQGYRTFAIEQRGYSVGASPSGRFQYSMDALVADVHHFIKTFDQAVYVMGHDWGSIVACELALQHPEVVKHLTLISVPHKGAFIKAALTSKQILASYYVLFFQLPVIPEFLFKRLPFLIRPLLKNSGMTKAQMLDFEKHFIKENRIGTAINWYRSMPLASPTSMFKKVSVPSLFVWGKNDVAIWEKSVRLNKDFFSNRYDEAFLDANHWIPNQNAEELTQHFFNAVK